jgi:hypothetical protein
VPEDVVQDERRSARALQSRTHYPHIPASGDGIAIGKVIAGRDGEKKEAVEIREDAGSRKRDSEPRRENGRCKKKDSANRRVVAQ